MTNETAAPFQTYEKDKSGGACGISMLDPPSSSPPSLLSLSSDTDSPPLPHARSGQPLTTFVLRAVCIASLGGVLFGYDLGVVSGALPQVTNAFALSQTQKESVVSFLYLGGGIGAAAGGHLCDAYGRRFAIILTDVTFVLGAFVLSLAHSFPSLLLGRFVVGFAVSVSGCADVAYLTEISPSAWRGSIVSCNEACISLGFLLAYLAGYGLSETLPEDGWRIMFGLSAVVAMVQFVGMWYMPESPAWLAEKNRVEEARMALKQIHELGDDECDHQKMQDVYREYMVDASAQTHGVHIVDHDDRGTGICGSGVAGFLGTKKKSTQGVLGREQQSQPPQAATSNSPLCRNPSPSVGSYESYTENDGNGKGDGGVATASRTSTLLSPPVTLSLSGRRGCVASGSGTQWCWKVMQRLFALSAEVRRYRMQAIVAVFLSAVQQFCGHTNVLNFAPEIFSQAGLVGGSSLASTVLVGTVKFIVTVYVIWKVDIIGRRTLLLFGMAMMSVSLLSMAIAFTEEDHDGDGQNDVRTNLALLGALGMAMGYASSFGPLTWLLTAEMFPPRIRGRALGCSTIVTYVCAAIVSYSFLSVQEHLGPSAPFRAYLIVTAAGLVFAVLAIPDTGGKSPEGIEEEMGTMCFWRQGGCAANLKAKAAVAISGAGSVEEESTTYTGISHASSFDEQASPRCQAELRKVV